MLSDDDFVDDAEVQEVDVRKRDLLSMQQRMSKEGYREAHEAGKEQAMQEAFDAGFSDGAKLGWETGAQYGSICAALWALDDPAASVTETDCVTRLQALKAKLRIPATQGLYTEDSMALLDEYASVMLLLTAQADAADG